MPYAIVEERKTVFKLDRNEAIPLSDHLVSRLKAAIVRGAYQPGETFHE